MPHLVSLEQVEGRWVAFVPALAGCFASAGTRDAALALLPEAVRSYLIWRRDKGDASVASDQEPTFEIEEIVREWPDPAHPEYIVSAFFAADAPPLTGQDISLGVRLLDWAYADLLTAGALPADVLGEKVEGDWSVAGILTHCSHAEWWYLHRLGLAPAQKEPSTWRERFTLAHQQLVTVLPTLEGVARIVLADCELWSPRKMLRRALWHERDHTAHIHQFRLRLGV